MEFESKFLKVGLRGKVKQRLEQETRYQNLADRFNGILSGMDKLGYMAKFGRMLFSDDIYDQNLADRFNGILSGMDKLGYMAKFGRMLFSDDIYEEMAIICSELGEENPLDT